nr:MAG TPA: hypothetical protein [Caudoviricetes sp.]
MVRISKLLNEYKKKLKLCYFYLFFYKKRVSYICYENVLQRRNKGIQKSRRCGYADLFAFWREKKLLICNSIKSIYTSYELTNC